MEYTERALKYFSLVGFVKDKKEIEYDLIQLLTFSIKTIFSFEAIFNVYRQVKSLEGTITIVNLASKENKSLYDYINPKPIQCEET